MSGHANHLQQAIAFFKVSGNNVTANNGSAARAKAPAAPPQAAALRKPARKPAPKVAVHTDAKAMHSDLPAAANFVKIA
jgi:hypothetical protein